MPEAGILEALPIEELFERMKVDPTDVDNVMTSCVDQMGEQGLSNDKVRHTCG